MQEKFPSKNLKRRLVLDIAVHKVFSKDLKKAQLNSTNTAKLFVYISLLLEGRELPAQAKENRYTLTTF